MSADSLQFNKTEVVEHLENIGGVTKRGLINEDLVRAENEDKTTPYLVFLISIAAIAGFLFGFDTGVVGSAVPLIGTELGHTLSNAETEIITAGTTIGAIFGSLVLGIWSDKIGCIIGTVILASAYSVGQAVAGRLVLGVGVGGASVIGPMYIAELAPTAVRGRCVGINAFFVPFGQTCASAIGAGFNKDTPHGWRILFAIGLVPAVTQLILMHWLPESPRIMVMQGKRDQAVRTLKAMYSKATDDILALKLRIIEDHVRESNRFQKNLSFWQLGKQLWTHKPYRRAIITVSGVQAFGQLTGYNTLLYYSSTIFGLLGFKNTAAAGLIASGGNAAFLLLGANIVDRVGRRRLLVTIVPGLITGLIWAAISFHFLTKDTNNRIIDGYTYNSAIAGSLLGAICLFVACFGTTLSHINWYQSEFLALEIRALGSAISTTLQWIANLIISVSYLSMLDTITPTGTYSLFLAFCVIGYIFVWFCYPETKGLSIDETELLFADGYGVQKSIEMRAKKAKFRHELVEENIKV
ncbi:MFS transporter, SP family, solute carrier family 2 (myo-inositol transporter), member 13 [Pseudohyphozyma bogoriensis]|nr:MFS transporter, SP family, solute carrier family 2 (myo-inositol transporter), member 13 [Pseudohyphozyma bogoriensis]